MFSADFETTTDPRDCRVWAWGISHFDTPADVTMGNDITSFIDHLTTLESDTIYFHNLKFDGTFIVDHLLKNGYTYQTRPTVTHSKGVSLLPQPANTFSTLMSHTGKLYSLTLGLPTGMIEFLDSMKLMNMGVDNVARTFNLPVSKGDLDYHTYRPPGHILTPGERDYIARDVEIVSRAMATLISDGMTKMTAGANALAEYQSVMGETAWDTHFPTLNPRDDDMVRDAYRGGYTYADKRYRGILLERQGVVLDVNSLYPSVMAQTQLPVGLPKRFDGEPPWAHLEGQLYLFTVKFTAHLKPGHIPIIQVKKSTRFVESEYQEHIPEPVTLTVTNIDWALYLKHYDIDVQGYYGGAAFDSRTDLFNAYIDKWMRVKEESKRDGNAGMAAIAKIMLNALYGKFATSTNVTGKIPELVKGAVVWRLGPEEEREPVYTPVGVFITAHARSIMINAAQANYDTFAYCDTDSIHLLRPDVPDTLDVHPTRIGAWDYEGAFTRALYIRAKAYAEEMGSGLSVHIAGVPTKIARSLTFDDLYDGHQIEGKLVPRNVPGGVVLTDTPYLLKF